MKSKLSAFLPQIIFGVMLLVLVLGVHQPKTAGFVPPVQYVGKLAPSIDLPVLRGSGARFTTAAWRGRPYLLNFFASWCGDCRVEREELMVLSSLHVPMIGVAFKDSAEKIDAFFTQFGNPYAAVAMDDAGRAFADWKLYGVPSTFLVDGYGVIRWSHTGGLTDSVVDHELMPVLEAVLHER